jgi:hypothetical protein
MAAQVKHTLHQYTHFGGPSPMVASATPAAQRGANAGAATSLDMVGDYAVLGPRTWKPAPQDNVPPASPGADEEALPVPEKTGLEREYLPACPSVEQDLTSEPRSGSLDADNALAPPAATVDLTVAGSGRPSPRARTSVPVAAKIDFAKRLRDRSGQAEPVRADSIDNQPRSSRLYDHLATERQKNLRNREA